MNWTKIWLWLDNFLEAAIRGDKHETIPDTPTPVVSPPTIPPNVSTPPAPAPVPPKYLWDTPANARHSLRVIADEEGLTLDQKNLMCQVVSCESGFKTDITHANVGKDGKVFSTDYGICQWNNVYHGKEISPDEALNNPEKAVRLMCQYVKAGKINQWVCFSSELYLRFPA